MHFLAATKQLSWNRQSEIACWNLSKLFCLFNKFHCHAFVFGFVKNALKFFWLAITAVTLKKFYFTRLLMLRH